MLALASLALAFAEPVDALDARVELDDAERFALLWERHGGTLDQATVQEDYLGHGGRALEIFTPGRIVDSANLAAKIASRPELYEDAVTRCLPWAREATPKLRATYLGLKGLLPEADLPRIAIVIGANNSGGTAREDMQVLGLEVLCRMSPDRAAFDAFLHHIFAHETVHAFQAVNAPGSNALLSSTLQEGAADYVAMLVTGQVPDAKRDAWAREREAFVYAEFARDMRIIGQEPDSDAANAAYKRWHGNAGSPPEGWPGELGYWVGRQIAAAFVEQADDKRQAIRELLSFTDAEAVLAASGLAERFEP